MTDQQAVARWHQEGTYLPRLWAALGRMEKDLEEVLPKPLRYIEPRESVHS